MQKGLAPSIHDGYFGVLFVAIIITSKFIFTLKGIWYFISLAKREEKRLDVAD